ncbi:hypothetical protein KBI52_21120 [Microvirga sp. HBU67558]|uniref:hypothetical protein n=1 Tax=Microvirga TaxID=186650 RepID=UPI001B369010|nr:MULTISPECIES: hypothetical protein [unclassified Microvirga]MBQ0822691.1 hypothetical protein [Microvirga sp. HBU67558]
MSLPPPPTRDELAYHEAGHAVIAHLSIAFILDGPVIIDDQDGSFGYCTDPDLDPKVTVYRVRYERAVVAAAGYAAQKLYNERAHGSFNISALQLGASDDAGMIREDFGFGVFDEFVAIATQRFNEDGVWEAVERLAARLAQSGQLSAEEAAKRIDEA